MVDAKGPPIHRPPRLGPRPYTNSAVNSFVASFVWVLWLDYQPRSAVAATPLAVSTPSDHDSPNAPTTARSVYVIAHPAARPLRLAPRFWVGLWPPVIVICAIKTQPPAAVSLGVTGVNSCGSAALGDCLRLYSNWPAAWHFVK